MQGRAKQSGQAMVEYLIVMPVLIMLIFGTIQAAFIYSAKNSLNYATFQAARIGSMNNATYEGMRRGLIRGLTPLFSHGSSEADLDNANVEAASEVDNFVRITRINPTLSAFSNSSFGEWDGDADDYSIPNDNLMYRSTIPAGAPALSLQDANLLKIRVQYCYRLIVPIVDVLLSAGSRFNKSGIEGSFGRSSRAAVDDYDIICEAGGRGAERKGIIITSEVTLRMQSPAYRDSDACSSDMTCL